MGYEAVIGQKARVQLKTKSKMRCGCADAFGLLPNTTDCSICVGTPGVLPVTNNEALRLTGLLYTASCQRSAKFDGKDYSQPDVAQN